MELNTKIKKENSFKMIFSYLKSHLWLIIIALFLATACSIFTIIGPNQIGDITTLISEGLLGDIGLKAIGEKGLFLVIIYSLSALFGFFQQYIMATVTLKMSYKMRKELSEKINTVPQKYFNTITQGDILSIITNDVFTLQQGLTNSLPTIISAVTQFIGCIIMMLITEWRLALISMSITFIGVILTFIIMSKSQKYFIMRQQSIGAINGFIEETYSGHDVIQLSRAEVKTKTTFDDLNEKVYVANWKS